MKTRNLEEYLVKQEEKKGQLTFGNMATLGQSFCGRWEIIHFRHLCDEGYDVCTMAIDICLLQLQAFEMDYRDTKETTTAFKWKQVKPKTLE